MQRRRRTVVCAVEEVLRNLDPDMLATGLAKGIAGQPRAASTTYSPEQAIRFVQHLLAHILGTSEDHPTMSEASREHLAAVSEKILANIPNI